ncbi:MAG: hypothetical protein K6A69_10390 [Lachnospiraceae bacterium]|nr:hypothetical protein [Lachnospiraceae bacterium]
MIEKWPEYAYRIMMFIAVAANIRVDFSEHRVTAFIIGVILLIALWAMLSVVYRHAWMRRTVTAALLITLLFSFATGNPGKLAVLPVLYLAISEAMSFAGGEGFSHKATFLIPILIVFLIPMKNTPIDWSFILRAAERIEYAAEDLAWFLGGGKERVGYGEMGTLGEGVDNSINRKPDLYLTNMNTNGVMYLKGSSYMSWGENSWEEKDIHSHDAGFLVPYLNALYRMDFGKEKVSCFSALASETVEYDRVRTNDILMPLYTINLEPVYKNPAILSEGILSDKADRGYTYRLSYLDLDTGSPYFKELFQPENVNTKEMASYDEMRGYFKRVYDADLRDFIREDEYNRTVEYLSEGKTCDGVRKEDYLKAGYSDKIQKLSLDITKGLSGDYDKALAIEEYLRSYSYNTAVHPGNGDRIEEFLFNSKEGYCVHFASAMALMLRANGIPARYCEGYYVSFGKESGSSKYVITPNAAHAWVEGYIDGFGWITFEPTPIKSSAAETGWGKLTMEDRMKGGISGEQESGSSDTGSAYEQKLAENKKDPEEEKRERIIFALKKAGIASLIILSYILLILVIRLIIRAIGYYRKDYTKRALFHISGAADLIRKRLKMEDPGITMREIFTAAGHEDILPDYYELRFGRKRLETGKEVKRYRDFYRAVKKEK